MTRLEDPFVCKKAEPDSCWRKAKERDEWGGWRMLLHSGAGRPSRAEVEQLEPRYCRPECAESAFVSPPREFVTGPSDKPTPGG
jgi:hypothetical protein